MPHSERFENMVESIPSNGCRIEYCTVYRPTWIATACKTFRNSSAMLSPVPAQSWCCRRSIVNTDNVIFLSCCSGIFLHSMIMSLVEGQKWSIVFLHKTAGVDTVWGIVNNSKSFRETPRAKVSTREYKLCFKRLRSIVSQPCSSGWGT